MNNSSVFKAGIALAVGLVLAAMVIALAVRSVQTRNQTVVVTGSAKQRIVSDLIIWRAAVTAESSQLQQAFATLSSNVPRVRQYLVSKGIPEEKIVIGPIQTITQRASQGRYMGEGPAAGPITGYSLRQQLEIRSNDVPKVTQISREVTELINQGILLESQPPEYLYTKLGEVKVQMLSEAAKDAKARAEQIASATGDSIGEMRAARMGVLQITPADSNEISGYGVNDTTSIEKDVTAVVNITFAVE